MARSTIKMWGPHLYSEDTRKKLQKYHALRHDSRLRSKIYDTTVHFDKPLSQRSGVGSETLASHREKHKKFREVFGSRLESKYDTVPYVDVAGLNRNDRPQTFVECVDFFYPMSGVSSHLSGHVPLTTTDPLAYDFSHYSYNVKDPWRDSGENFRYRGSNKDTTSMPVDLGEVTMMYTWFIIYKLLLSPKARDQELLIEPEQFLQTVPGRRNLLTDQHRRQMHGQTQDFIGALQTMKFAVEMGGEVAKGFASGQIEDFDSFVTYAKNNKLLEPAKAYFTGEVQSFISKKLGLPESLSHKVAGFLVGKALTPSTYENLDQIDLANFNTVVKGTINGITDSALANLPSASEASKIVKAYALKNFDSLRNLSSQGSQIVNRLKQADSKVYRKLYTDAIGKVKQGARPNEPMTMALISGGVMVTKAGLDHLAQRAAAYNTKIGRYYDGTRVKINPVLANRGIDLSFTAFKPVGIKDDDFYDKEWVRNSKPYCNPSNNLLSAEYARNLYTVFRPIIATLKNHPELSLKTVLNDTRSNFYYKKILSEFNIDLENGTLNRQPLFTQSWTCKTFNFFFKYCIESTKIVLNDIMSFSPFTQAYGFEPAFLDSKGEGAEELKGYVRNAVLGIIGSPSSKAGWEYTTAKKGGYYQPGIPHSWARETSHDDDRWSVGHRQRWKTSGLQSLKNHFNSGSDSRGRFKHTINSQRRLNDDVPFGHFGYTSLAFDVAYGIPIFNAQWSAAVSVLMCYPDALKKCADSGYSWARRVRAEYVGNNRNNTAMRLPAFIQQSSSQGGATINLPSEDSQLTSEDSQLTSEDSQLTSGEEDSVTGLYVALGLGITAIAGASYYVIQKKKGKL
jgi:hypothetical protein